MSENPKGYISIEEASELAGVSPKTIRRRLKAKKLKSRKIKNKYHVSIKSLKENYPKIEDDQLPGNESEYIKVPKEVYETLQEQLKEKDKQIERLDQKLTQQQILHKELQDRLPMLEAPKEYKQDKEGFWKRLFKGN